MSPTLASGERMLVNRFVFARIDSGPFAELFGADGYVFHGPERGDIIVFHPPQSYDTDFVKRVIGLPGDVIDIRGGFVYVNGQKLDEPYLSQTTSPQGGSYPRTVPEGHYFVLGDNRRVSNDSRNWGFVRGQDVVGRAWIGYWPLPKLRFFG
jgi:signal peptidase I